MIAYKTALGAALLALVACAALPPGRPMTMMPAGDCFSTTQWRGWSSPTDDVLYLRVGANDIYRIDLVPGSGRIDHNGDFIISQVTGSTRVCSANDMQLSIANSAGFRSPIFPRAIRKLTAEEVAALPPSDRP
ncbi:MAG TPA: hypothetical protein VF138_07485 [Caulobacteraceae bacterium]